jgi:hypothetical protein
VDGVPATVSYLAPGSARNALYVAPADHLATARYEPRVVTVRDARPRAGDFTLDGAGFTLTRHRSAINGLDDAAALDDVYTPEALALARELTGADHVVSLGWMLRSSSPERALALPPAPDVHVDLINGVIAQRYARVHARSALPRPGEYRRAVYTSLWRVLSPPPQDWPLALCDYRSVADDEGVPNFLFRVASLPESPGRELPAELSDAAFDEAGAESAAAVFEFRPAHRWWYFPAMSRDEALLIKLHDTDRSVAWRAPHTSFLDSTVFLDGTAPAGHAAPGGGHRESIELRSVAYLS